MRSQLMSAALAVATTLAVYRPSPDILDPEAREFLRHISMIDLPTGYDGITARTVRISGLNVQIVDGSGHTFRTTDSVDGSGNLLVGYNEESWSDGWDRRGRHNITVGEGNSYSTDTWGSLVTGYSNTIDGAYSAIISGTHNVVYADNSAIVSGWANEIHTGATNALALGGGQNTCWEETAVVCGGRNNFARNPFSVVCGGQDNGTYGDYATVSGGHNRRADYEYDWVAGGLWQDD